MDPAGLNNPAGIAVDANNHLYVADYSNNRILGYNNAASFADNAAANLVIGQTDFYSASCNQNGPVSANTLCNPDGLAVDKSGNLFVADLSNNRVLEYSAPFKSGHTTNQAATVAIGQINTTSRNNNTSRNGLSGPSGVTLDSLGKLYVVDQSNNRVLQFVPPFVSNQNANLVIGQSTFLAGACNRGVATNSGNLCGPVGAAVDAAGNLYVADSQNSRVLEYNAPLSSGEAAARVFGQLGNFTANHCNGIATGLNADSLCTPQGVGLDAAGNLYIADSTGSAAHNNRVLEYNTPLQKTGVPGSGDTTADRVFGQADNFTSSLCNFGATAPSAGQPVQPGECRLRQLR